MVNTTAAALEIDLPTLSVQVRRKAPGLLYLPDSGWLDIVGVLIRLAERIVVWVHEKTPALLQELDLITELGRAGDTLILVEKIRGREVRSPAST